MIRAPCHEINELSLVMTIAPGQIRDRLVRYQNNFFLNSRVRGQMWQWSWWWLSRGLGREEAPAVLKSSESSNMSAGEINPDVNRSEQPWPNQSY